MSNEREKNSARVLGRVERKQTISENLARSKQELVNLVYEKRAEAEKLAAEKASPFREVPSVQPQQPVDTIEMVRQKQPDDFTVTHTRYSYHGHDGLYGGEYTAERTIVRIENGQILTIHFSTDYTFSATPSPTPDDIDQDRYEKHIKKRDEIKPKLVKEESEQFAVLAQMTEVLARTPMQLVDPAPIDS